MTMSTEDSLNEIRKKLETEDERNIFDAMVEAGRDAHGIVDLANVVDEFSSGPLDPQEHARECYRL